MGRITKTKIIKGRFIGEREEVISYISNQIHQINLQYVLN